MSVPYGGLAGNFVFLQVGRSGVRAWGAVHIYRVVSRCKRGISLCFFLPTRVSLREAVGKSI